MNIVIWFFVIIVLIILVKYATNKLIDSHTTHESFGNSVIDNDIILTYAEVLQRQPNTRELIEQSRNINSGLITMDDLRQRLITGEEYQRLKKLQSNELSPELPKVIEDTNLMNKVSKLYESELLTDIPSNIILPLKDIYVYLGYNDKAFKAMLRSKNYDNFESDLQYSYNNNLNYEMTMSLFFNYFDPATLKSIAFSINDSVPRGALLTERISRTIEDTDGDSTNLLSQIDSIANGVFDINKAARNLNTPTNKVKLLKEKKNQHQNNNASLLPKDIYEMTARNANLITADMIASFNTQQLQAMSPDLLFELLKLNADVFKKLTEQQVLSFTPVQINQVSLAISATFANSKTLVSDLTPDYIASLSFFEIRVMPNDILNQFSASQIKALTPLQILVLSQDQKQALQITNNLNKLSDELRAGFTPSTMENDFAFQFQPLTPVQLSLLTPAELLGLPDQQKQLITNDQMKSDVDNRTFDYTSRPPAQVNLDQLYDYTGLGSQNGMGSVAGASVAGGSVAGGSVAGASVAGGSVAAGSVAGASVAAGSVAGGSVAGASVAGGSVAGASVAGASVAGGSVAGASVAAGSVAGASVAVGSVNAFAAAMVNGSTGFQSTPALGTSSYKASISGSRSGSFEHFENYGSGVNSLRKSLYGVSSGEYNNVATMNYNVDETDPKQYYDNTQPYVNGKIPTHRGDMVLLPEMAWSVPMPRAPVCTTFGQTPLVQPLYENSKLLLGTPLDQDTSVGTIMPKFEYKEYINMQM